MNALNERDTENRSLTTTQVLIMKFCRANQRRTKLILFYDNFEKRHLQYFYLNSNFSSAYFQERFLNYKYEWTSKTKSCNQYH